MRDKRALVMVELPSGVRVTLCGSHELMHRRSGEAARTIDELRERLADRRGTDRRALRGGEVDELAERLTAAFTTDRRSRVRRAS